MIGIVNPNDDEKEVENKNIECEVEYEAEYTNNGLDGFIIGLISLFLIPLSLITYVGLFLIIIISLIGIVSSTIDLVKIPRNKSRIYAIIGVICSCISLITFFIILFFKLIIKL